MFRSVLARVRYVYDEGKVYSAIKAIGSLKTLKKEGGSLLKLMTWDGVWTTIALNEGAYSQSGLILRLDEERGEHIDIFPARKSREGESKLNAYLIWRGLQAKATRNMFGRRGEKAKEIASMALVLAVVSAVAGAVLVSQFRIESGHSAVNSNSNLIDSFERDDLTDLVLHLYENQVEDFSRSTLSDPSDAESNHISLPAPPVSQMPLPTKAPTPPRAPREINKWSDLGVYSLPKPGGGTLDSIEDLRNFGFEP